MYTFHLDSHCLFKSNCNYYISSKIYTKGKTKGLNRTKVFLLLLLPSTRAVPGVKIVRLTGPHVTDKETEIRLRFNPKKLPRGFQQRYETY